MFRICLRPPGNFLKEPAAEVAIRENIDKHELDPKKQILILYIGRKSIRTRMAKAMNKAGLNDIRHLCEQVPSLDFINKYK